jgi:23S rRNA (pseudouridine1915-N3)-methyltransferase
MKKIIIISIGNLKEKYWRDAQDEYLKRLGKYAQISNLELKESKITNENSTQAIISDEQSKILAKIKQTDFVIALSIQAQPSSSEKLSKQLGMAIDSSFDRIIFVIGGSHGLGEDVKQRANYQLAFGPLTLPHQLARIVLLEQTFRAFKIIKNERYHK